MFEFIIMLFLCGPPAHWPPAGGRFTGYILLLHEESEVASAPSYYKESGHSAGDKYYADYCE